MFDKTDNYVPAATVKVAEEDVPAWLQKSVAADGAAVVGESDSRQVFRRLAGCWAYWGWKGGYFGSEADALAFHDETRHILAALRTGHHGGVRPKLSPDEYY